MKRLSIVLVMTLMCSVLMAQTGFREYLEYNIEYFQQSEKLSYTIGLRLYEDSISSQTNQTEQMHVYSSRGKQCVSTADRVMIKEGNVLVSILEDEQSVVVQNSSESFRSDYAEQLKVLLGGWETLKIETKSSSSSEMVFSITMPAGMDYSAMELTFNKKTKLLSRSIIWLRGQYTMGESTYNAPRIEMTVSRLLEPKIARLSIADILTKDFELTEEYRKYVLYNTIQK